MWGVNTSCSSRFIHILYTYVCKEIKKVLKKHQLHIAKQSKKNGKVFWNYINSKHKGRSDIGHLKSYDTYNVVYIINLLHTTQRCVYKIFVAYAQRCLIRCVYNKSVAFYTRLCI